MRSCPNPNAAEANLHPANQIQSLGKYFAFIERSIAIGVFEYQNSVAALPVFGSFWILIRLCDPDPTAIIDCHCDGLLNIRLGGTHYYLEAIRQLHLLGRLLSTQAFERIFVQHHRRFRFGYWAELTCMQSEAIEVQMPPCPFAFID